MTIIYLTILQAKSQKISTVFKISIKYSLISVNIISTVQIIFHLIKMLIKKYTFWPYPAIFLKYLLYKHII